MAAQAPMAQTELPAPLEALVKVRMVAKVAPSEVELARRDGEENAVCLAPLGCRMVRPRARFLGLQMAGAVRAAQAVGTALAAAMAMRVAAAVALMAVPVRRASMERPAAI